MTDAQYKSHMSDVINALSTALLLTQHITDDEVEHMADTIRHAESLSFVMVLPLEFGQKNDNLQAQQQALKWLTDSRKVMAGMRELAGLEVGN